MIIINSEQVLAQSQLAQGRCSGLPQRGFKDKTHGSHVQRWKGGDSKKEGTGHCQRVEREEAQAGKRQQPAFNAAGQLR